jgi:hypothetical protein
MSKKLMLPFLMEWLIKYGTTPTDTSKMEKIPITMLIKATRLGYLIDVSVGMPMIVKLTKEGIRYLKDNEK